MPYTPVSCGTGHSFGGTGTLPYAYWGGECQSKRAPAFSENTFWCCVLDRTQRDAAGIVRWSDRMKEFSKEADQRA